VNGSGKNIVILGAGESGVGTAVLAKKHGWTVFVSDFGKISPEFQAELETLGVEWEQGQHTQERILSADLVMKSPGIPEKAPIIKALREKGVKIVSEIEFAGYYNKAKTICITGSNGKTTTTMLVHHILKKAGVNVGLGGNVGKSFAKQVANENFDWYVLEISSFQLDDMYDFRADISILTNITPDHLDRYNYDMSLYVASKMRIINNQTADNWFIYNADDPTIAAALEGQKLQMKTAPFSMTKTLEVGGYYEEETKQITININDPLIMSVHDFALKGRHNTQNSLAAGIAARIVEIQKESVRESLEDFVNVEHRLEFVAKVNGIEFINDSKATNINSTWYALESMTNPTVWIVGGVDKGNDYNELMDLVKSKVKAIVCLGLDNAKIIEAFEGVVETIVEAKSAMEAVSYAYQLSEKNDTVLLSPACASFDLFTDYQERGNQFKQAVRRL